jgi:AcrR family transcriptional regulator
VSSTAVRRPRGRPSSATKEQFLDATTERFLAGERVDIQAICSQLGLSRATVHRWCGSRDRVLGEVMVGLVVPLFRRIERETRGAGGKRLVDVFERQLRALVEPRVVALIEEMIEEEVARGYAPPADPGVVAYAIVRIAESFLYADAAAGFRGDFGRVRAVYAALLGVSPR